MHQNDPILDMLAFDEAQVFAVVDGAMVDDLPATLTSYNLSARPLYYDHHSHIANTNGPHLIHCQDESVIMTVRGALPAQGVVWWVWADPDESHAKAAIFRHLRGLGMVEIPEGYPNEGRPRAPMERVLFRHADARVMARVLPVLEQDQRARLFGKAGALVLEVDGTLRRALVPAGLPLAPPGFLRLTAGQMDVISKGLQTEHNAAVSRFLRRHLPYETKNLSDAELDTLSGRASLRARELNLEQDESILMFAFLVAMTGGAALTAPEIEAALKDEDYTPDTAMKALMQSIRDAESAGV